jgi:predicted methyltransferase
MWSRAPLVQIQLTTLLAMLLAACASAPRPATVAPQPAPPRDAVTAAAIERVLASEHRAPGNRARDGQQHPQETLLFFGIKPAMTVAEVWPGTGGWYTEILAPLLAEHGKLYVAQMPPAPGNEFIDAGLAAFAGKLAAHPELYGKVTLTTLGSAGGDIAPPGSCDLVVTFREMHNWMNLGYAREAFVAMNRALKPGGTLGVVESRAPAGKPQDPRATSGYVDENLAIGLIESAGFELAARSQVNDNPRDTKDYEQGVWTLPPDFRQGQRDRAKFEAIGESDRFTLKFRKK